MLSLLFFVSTLASSVWIYRKLANLDSDFSLWWLERFGKPLDDLRGKVIWITGSASGIGQSVAFELANCGCKLALSDVNESGLAETVSRCISLGVPKDDVLTLPFDLKNSSIHQKIYDEIINYFGRIDVFVHNAGIAQRSAFHEIDIQVDREIFEINVFSGVNLSRLLVRHWYESNYPGQIVVTSSITGKFALTNSASYTASKHALVGYYECLRNESYGKNVKVTILCPGPTESQGLPSSFTGKYGERYGRDFPRRGRRISAERQARMYAVAIVNKVEEAWTSLPPFLYYCYLFQYFPTIMKRIYPRFLADTKIASVQK
ncbi:dehydrogenase/reductase SDR family member 7-like [Brevipalpus obovatus]|uniref:dehydrogenase/reductase SDR family member 7-like n=1 Tax=Brevipalpus obovatus TaxID=246614 RepID=UPI003D9E9F40